MSLYTNSVGTYEITPLLPYEADHWRCDMMMPMVNWPHTRRCDAKAKNIVRWRNPLRQDPEMVRVCPDHLPTNLTPKEPRSGTQPDTNDPYKELQYTRGATLMVTLAEEERFLRRLKAFSMLVAAVSAMLASIGFVLSFAMCRF